MVVNVIVRCVIDGRRYDDAHCGPKSASEPHPNTPLYIILGFNCYYKGDKIAVSVGRAAFRWGRGICAFGYFPSPHATSLVHPQTPNVPQYLTISHEIAHYWPISCNVLRVYTQDIDQRLKLRRVVWK